MRFSRAFLRALFGIALAGSVVTFLPPAIAQINPPPPALPPQAVQKFLADPAGWMAQFPNGGPQMIAQTRDLAASDPATLNALISLLASANPQQASAIGTGLGQAALLSVKTNQAYATLIQTALVASQNVSAVVAFSAVVGGDIKLAAAGPGAGGGPGGGGGGGGESPTGPSGTTGAIGGSSSPTTNTFASTIPDTFTTPSFSPSSSTSP